MKKADLLAFSAVALLLACEVSEATADLESANSEADTLEAVVEGYCYSLQAVINDPSLGPYCMYDGLMLASESIGTNY